MAYKLRGEGQHPSYFDGGEGGGGGGEGGYKKPGREVYNK